MSFIQLNTFLNSYQDHLNLHGYPVCAEVWLVIDLSTLVPESQSADFLQSTRLKPPSIPIRYLSKIDIPS